MKKRLLLTTLICLCSHNMALALTRQEAQAQKRRERAIELAAGQDVISKKIRNRAKTFEKELVDQMRYEIPEGKTEKQAYTLSMPEIAGQLREIFIKFAYIHEKIKEISKVEGIAKKAWEYPLLLRHLLGIIQIVKAGFGTAKESLTDGTIDGHGHRAEAAQIMLGIIENNKLGRYSKEAGALRADFSKRHHASVNYFINKEKAIFKILQEFKKRLNNEAYKAAMTKGFRERGLTKGEFGALEKKVSESFETLLKPREETEYPPQYTRDVALTGEIPDRGLPSATKVYEYKDLLDKKTSIYYSMVNKERELTREAWDDLIKKIELSVPIQIEFKQRFMQRLQRARVAGKTKFQKWRSDFLKLLTELRKLLKRLSGLTGTSPRIQKQIHTTLPNQIKKKVDAILRKNAEFDAIYEHTTQVYKKERENLVHDASKKGCSVKKIVCFLFLILSSMGYRPVLAMESVQTISLLPKAYEELSSLIKQVGDSLDETDLYSTLVIDDVDEDEMKMLMDAGEGEMERLRDKGLLPGSILRSMLLQERIDYCFKELREIQSKLASQRLDPKNISRNDLAKITECLDLIKAEPRNGSGSILEFFSSTFKDGPSRLEALVGKI